jgi:uncharacterized membrane protein
MKLLNWTKSNYILIAIVVLAAGLRLYHINFQSVWLDEIHTLNEANPTLTFSQFFDSLKASDPHPPLYFILARLSFSVFGYATIVLRVLSALIGIAGVAAIYFLGKEIYSRTAGIYASLLIAVNYFHIFHSQDGRPYALLFLTTVMSFTFLIRFIKSPSAKSAAVYALFASLMIYSHFFALFALVAQAVILLYFIYKPNIVPAKKFFLYCLMAGAIIVVLYLPCYPLVKAATSMTSIWIPVPTLDTYKEVWKEFFGHSNAVIYLILGLMVLYVAMYFAKRRAGADTPERKTYGFSLLIILIWIIVTVLIPVVRSYVSLPMIISRYFINIVPAIVLMAAIALCQIKNTIVRNGLVILICLLSLNNIILDKKYYTTVIKSQFREVSNYIKENTDNSVPVVSSLYWHFDYFFRNTGFRLLPDDLNSYVKQISEGKIKKGPFWYVDAHSRTYNPTPETAEYLKQNFDVQSRINLFDAWTIQYVPKEN